MEYLCLIVTVLSLVSSARGGLDTCQKPSNNTCKQTCLPTDKTCSMNCGKGVDTCNQFCLRSNACELLRCETNVNTCRQNSFYSPKKVKMTCSSNTCYQRCAGNICEMECKDTVKTCTQVCSGDAKCTLSCAGNTKCETVCTDGTCVYKGKKPIIPPSLLSICDQERCNKNCSGDCRSTNLTCDNTKLCNLVCDDGCKMKCGKAVDTCIQVCRGKINCDHTCESKSCQIKDIKSASNSFRAHVIFILILASISLLFDTY